jgi:hypothetical protein
MKQPKFQPKTIELISNLRKILYTKSYYPTLGHFYREIELLKFPYLKNAKPGDYYYSSHGRNVYSQQQYDSIVDYCVSQGWVNILPKKGNTYHVFIPSTPEHTWFEHREQQHHTNKAIQIARNTTYGSFTPNGENEIVRVELELDPKLTWVVRTENGKSYLTIKK